MKRNFLLTMLLTALMVIGTSNAWAKTNFEEAYSAESTTDGWTTSVSDRFIPSILEESGNYFLSVDQNSRYNNGCIVTGTILAGKVAAGQDFTLTFDMRLGNSSNQTPVTLAVKDAANSDDILSIAATGNSVTTWTVNGKADRTVTLPGSGSNKNANAIYGITWCTYKVSRSGALTYVTITNRETGDPILERTYVEASATGGLGNIVFATRRYYANFAIDNIVLRDLEEGDVPDVELTTYTLRYVDEGGSKLKDDVVLNSYVGAEVTANSSQTASFMKDILKYIYKSGNSTITLGADATKNVITLTFRPADTYEYTVRAVDADNNLIKVLKNGTAFEQDEMIASWPLYLMKNDMIYERGAVSNQYYQTFTLTQDMQKVDLKYTVSSVEKVVFITEGEDIAGASVLNTGNALARCSNAAAGYAAAEDLLITTLPAGEYILNSVGHFPNSGLSTITITDGTDILQTISGEKSNWLKQSDNISLTAETKLYLSKGSSNAGLDFIYIQDASAHANVFTVNTEEGVPMKFHIVDNVAKTCEVYGVFSNNGTAIDLTTVGKITIPAEADGYKVVGISGWAFLRCHDITEVVLPETITYIGESAFRTCDNLSTINLPEGFETIGGNAFYGCSRLYEIELPSTIKSIGDRGLCASGLSTIRSNMTVPCTLGNEAIYYQSLATLYVPAGTRDAYRKAWGEFKKIIDPADVFFTADINGVTINFRVVSEKQKTVETCIDYDFSNAITDITDDGNYIEDIVLPKQVTNAETGTTYTLVGIGLYSFRNSWNLSNASIEVPEGVTYIDYRAFSSCSFRKIVLPSTLKDVNKEAFRYLYNIEEMKVATTKPYAIEGQNFITMSDATLYVPKGSREAYAEADFWKEFGNIVEYYPTGHIFTATTEQGVDMQFRVLDENAATCEVYTAPYDENNGSSFVPAISESYHGKLIIPAEIDGLHVVGISSWAFREHKGITSVVVPATVTYIGASAFRRCTYLASANIPEGVTTIGDNAFFGTVITYFSLPSTLQTIGERALDVYARKVENYSSDEYWHIVANMVVPAKIENVSDVLKKYDLYVPKGSRAAYQADAVWKQFKAIYVIGQSTDANILNADGLTIQAGTTAQMNIAAMASSNFHSGYHTRLVLPEGLTIATDNEGNYKVKSAVANSQLNLDVTYEGDGSYLISAQTADGSRAIATQGGSLFTLDVMADRAMNAGEYVGRVEETVLISDDGTVSPANVSFTVTVEAAAEETEQAPVYAEDVECIDVTYITRPIYLNNSNPIAGFLFQLTLPKSFTVPTNSDGTLKAQMTSNFADVPLIGANIGNNTYRFFAFDREMKNCFDVKAGHVLNVKVNIPLELPSGDYTVKMTTVKFQTAVTEEDEQIAEPTETRRVMRAAEEKTDNLTSFSVIRVRRVATDIESATSTSFTPSSSQCFDLQGRQMVNRELSKGLYIKGGKKVVVK